ncbi:hypothetical protein D0Y65_027504 [Glycine soja]|uniref:RRM domain-containing protein n=1 Tax=Glycine soja TaxID=3848 RepID=A0A445IPN9_GLYSO|nr:hypothetical protein D0Y65_027504 [Glycine soja]
MNVTSLDWDHGSLTNSLQTTPFERSETDVVEAPTTEDEDEIKSVYVRNLSPTVSVSEIEEEFKNFGRIRLDSAGSVEVAGRQVYIEERRPNRKGRGRSSYQSEVQRGRFGPRSFGRLQAFIGTFPSNLS